MLLGLLALGGAALAALSGADQPLYRGGGLLMPAMPDPVSPEMSLALSCAAMITVAALMVIINRTFNLLRTSSILLSGLYLFMQCSAPIVSARLSEGTLLTIMTLVLMSLLYSCYQRPASTQTVFLAFLLCTGATFAQAAALIYLPVILVGCMQMRCFTFRSALAAGLGVVTPFWLVAGFAPELLKSIAMPSIVSPGSLTFSTQTLQLTVTVAFVLVWAVTMLMLNLYRVYSYNARARALNGLMATMTVATMILAAVDFAHVDAYLPTLFCFTALQTALFFRINYERRSYIWVLALLGVCVSLYIWNLWI